MKTLHLFAGAGGGLLADILLGHTQIGYVEWNEHCQRVIAQRIEDGWIAKAPIFGDVRTFASEGFAGSYTGMVDLLCAGFPCQPFSQAGHQKGEDDERNMWPATAQCIRIIQPRICLLENVPSLITSGYISRVFSDLASMGYGFAWGVMGSGETGSCINGERLWIVAVAANGSVLEGMDVSQYRFSGSEESRRRQHTGAISAMLSQDDYTILKRDSNEVAEGMERLKAIGNGQDGVLAATAFGTIMQMIEACNA